jgi:hypothetical protein
MHKNAQLLDRFYKGVQDHDHLSIADCYHPSARFKDIAFDLSEKKMIRAVWHMISKTDLEIKYTVEDADENNGRAFTDTGNTVHNKLESTFRFQDGLIFNQVDDCDAWNWGMQALGPAYGFVSWLIPKVRRNKAMGKLHDFIKHHPEYQ